MNILLFSRRTVYETAVRDVRSGRLKKLIQCGHRSVKSLKRAHTEHQRTLEHVEALLGKLGFSHRLVYDLRGVKAERFDLVMTVGGDGTVLYASHHVASDPPMFGVNSSPSTSAGYLTSADRGNLKEKLLNLRQGKIRRSTLQRLTVALDDELVHDRVLNDVLFASHCQAVPARYCLRIGRIEEEQMSSGIWIGPAAGSTAAILSAGGRRLPTGSKKIQFVVREPVRRPGCRLTSGVVGQGEKIVILNKWQRAKIFVDGPHHRAPVEPGQRITVQASDSPLVLLGWRRR
ncbi:MAG: NAD(+)/NADH kinase [Pseudomonadota bacterium]